MTFSSSTSIFLISLSAIPITYLVNSAKLVHGEIGLFISGVVALAFVCGLVFIVLRVKGQITDPIIYAFCVCAFGGVASFIIALEADGIIHGFMTEYIRSGEPYLKTAHGTLVSYWDGIVHYALVLMMLSAISWNQSYREVGLYWIGSLGHSMIVFIPGNIVGKYGIRWSFLLNVPYIIIPFVCGARFLMERPKDEVAVDSSSQTKSILRRPLDLFFVVGLIYSLALALFRGFAVLGTKHDIFNEYLTNIEPYLEDPVAYGKIQMLVYLFYYTLYYVMAIYGLVFPGCSWMPDWSLIHAGAAAQGQVVHIGTSLHHRTPYILRVPPNNVARGVFWCLNIFLLIFPHLLALRCTQDEDLFNKPEDEDCDASKSKIKDITTSRKVDSSKKIK